MELTFISRVKGSLKGDVDDSPETRTSHSTDASLFKVMPSVVIYPKDADDVSTLVRLVAEEKKNDANLSITPRSAGTCMAGSSLTSSISLDGMRYLGGIGPVEDVPPYKMLPHFPGAEEVEISGSVTVGTGTYYRDLEPKTLAKGLLLPCFTASKTINAIGGMIGNNSGGELSLKYGKTQDYVESLDVVLSDGTKETIHALSRKEAEARAENTDRLGSIYKDILALIDANRELIEAKRPKVSKNSAGYNIWNVSRINPKTKEETIDLTQLIVGSEGTLAIATGAKLRLVKKKQASGLMVVFLKDLAVLPDVVGEALKVSPETVEAYDDKTILLAVKFWTGFIKKRGFWGALKLGLSFIPEFLMMLTGGMPKLVLLVECAGEHKDEVDARMKFLKRMLRDYKGVHAREARSSAEAEKFWTIRHDSFALLREHFKGKRTAPFIDDVIVPPATLPEFIPAIRTILEKHGLSYNIHGHAGNGNFHIIPLIDTDARLSEKMILDVSEEVYSLVLRLGGSITAEHNDGIIRTPYLLDMFGPEMIEIFKKIKTIFDPDTIFNPGKKVGLTKADIGKYLISGE